MFYDRFIKLCEEARVKPSNVATECGFDRSSVSKWKKDGFTPRQEILVKIADYFKVSVDFLLGNEGKADPDEALKFALFGGDARYISPEALEDVKKFAQFVAENERRKNGNDIN